MSRRPFSRIALLAALALGPGARAADVASDVVTQPAGDTAVRRYEWVVTVRTSTEFPDAMARAEIAAGRAGGAVLEDLRMDASGAYSDHRVLVRTLDRESISQVLVRMRATRGVVGATAAPLPETPTWSGGPGFMESYTAESDYPVSNAGRVLVRHDVPPVADKQELLEAADVVAGPGLPSLDSLGGFTLNVSELFKRMKASSWRKREAKLRDTPMVILPPDGSPAPAYEPMAAR